MEFPCACSLEEALRALLLESISKEMHKGRNGIEKKYKHDQGESMHFTVHRSVCLWDVRKAQSSSLQVAHSTCLGNTSPYSYHHGNQGWENGTSGSSLTTSVARGIQSLSLTLEFYAAYQHL